MKRIFILLFCLVALLGNGKEIEPYDMSYSYPNSKDIYDPHVYNDYKYGVVHTEQLEIQEYILQRLDWLHLNVDNLANKKDKNLIIIPTLLNSIKLLVIQLIILMVCIFIMLVAMFYAIYQNNKMVKQRK